MAVVRPPLSVWIHAVTQSRIRMLTHSACFALIRCGYGLSTADTACCDGADDTNLDYYWGDFKRVCDSNGDGVVSRAEFFAKVRKQQLFLPHFIL